MIRERNELEKEIEKLVTEINKKGVINYYRNSYKQISIIKKRA